MVQNTKYKQTNKNACLYALCPLGKAIEKFPRCNNKESIFFAIPEVTREYGLYTNPIAKATTAKCQARKNWHLAGLCASSALARPGGIRAGGKGDRCKWQRNAFDNLHLYEVGLTFCQPREREVLTASDFGSPALPPPPPHSLLLTRSLAPSLARCRILALLRSYS